MYKELLKVVKNRLNERISEIDGGELLPAVVRELTGTYAYVKLSGPSKMLPSLDGEKIRYIEQASYSYKSIKIAANGKKIKFPCTGMIASEQQTGLSLFFPSSKEPGVNLILLVLNK